MSAKEARALALLALGFGAAYLLAAYSVARFLEALKET